MAEGQYDISNIMSFLRETNVKSFDSSADIYDIIRAFLDENHSDSAFYIVDLTKIIEQYNKWFEYLPNIHPYYAIKCNPNKTIIKLLDKLGVNFDCASQHEIAQVLSSGVSPERIIYANPCKISSYIKYARSTDVDLLVLDSTYEIYKIKLYHPAANLLIRIKIDDSKSLCRFSSKFGCSLKQVNEICALAKASKLNVVGISFHVGSNCRDPETYRNAIELSKKAFEIGQTYGYTFNLLDIGGGFPGHNDGSISFENIVKVINESINDCFGGYDNGVKFIAEPGRYFVSASHTLLLNVIGKKDIEESHDLELDQLNKLVSANMGMQSEDYKKIESTTNTTEKRFVYYLNDGVYGSFDCIAHDHYHPILKPYNERDGKLYKSIVFGPTCDSVDVITQDCELPDLAIGEWVFVDNFGAYTRAAASTFNGFQEIPCFYIMKNN